MRSGWPPAPSRRAAGGSKRPSFFMVVEGKTGGLKIVIKGKRKRRVERRGGMGCFLNVGAGGNSCSNRRQEKEEIFI